MVDALVEVEDESEPQSDEERELMRMLAATGAVGCERVRGVGESGGAVVKRVEGGGEGGRGLAEDEEEEDCRWLAMSRAERRRETTGLTVSSERSLSSWAPALLPKLFQVAQPPT